MFLKCLAVLSVHGSSPCTHRRTHYGDDCRGTRGTSRMGRRNHRRWTADHPLPHVRRRAVSRSGRPHSPSDAAIHDAFCTISSGAEGSVRQKKQIDEPSFLVMWQCWPRRSSSTRSSSSTRTLPYFSRSRSSPLFFSFASLSLVGLFSWWACSILCLLICMPISGLVVFSSGGRLARFFATLLESAADWPSRR